MKFNYEYHKIFESKEYRIGKSLLWYVNKVKAFRFDEILSRLKKRTQYKELNDMYGVDRSAIVVNNAPLRIGADSDKSFTVYTCITGNYELPKVPLVIPSNYNFVLFSDTIKQCEGWDVRSIPEELKNRYDNPEINRYIKFHPASFFDTDYSLYIDGNVKFVAGISSILNANACESGLWMFDHPSRNCIFQEADACIKIKKGNCVEIVKQIDRYKEEGMPQNYGLKEATAIFTEMKNHLAISLLNDWWNEYYLSFSKRDQLALPYILWKRGLTLDQIGNLGPNIRSDMHFIVSSH
jgi:hypothetical protein